MRHDKITSNKITIPPSDGLELGADGSVISSGGRVFTFKDAIGRNTLFSHYSYDNAGGTSLTYWDIASRQTDNVSPDSGVTLPDPQELTFSGAVGNVLTRSFNVIPKTTGTLRVQSWEGTDDTGAVLVDRNFTILVGDIDNITMLEFPVGLASEIGDVQFVRFSGVQLSGSLSQSAGMFIGQECPFLDSEVQALTARSTMGGYLETLINSESLASSQEPSSLDSPIQIEFGAAQITGAVELDAIGTVTFNEAGLYFMNVTGQYGAPQGGGESALRFRVELNGSPIGNVLSATVKDTKTSVPLVATFWIQVEVGDLWEAYLLRDSSENNKGGLFQETTALAGWDDSPSAAIVIERFI